MRESADFVSCGESGKGDVKHDYFPGNRRVLRTIQRGRGHPHIDREWLCGPRNRSAGSAERATAKSDLVSSEPGPST
jgi:hypothetical protein